MSMAPDPMLPRLARVRGRRRDGPQTWTLDIECDDGDLAPGQFNMLTMFGVGEIPVSVSAAVRKRHAHTIRAVGPVSEALAHLKPGDALGLRGPFGHGWPMEDARGRDVVIVAGGLGLAPLRPAIHALIAARKRTGKVTLLYGTRGPGEILYRRELESWRRRGIDVKITVDHAPAGWRGHVGVVTTLISRGSFDAQRSIAFVCGPEIMMRFVIAALRDAGMAGESIYLSMERNMKCAIGLCGHCQFGPVFVCRDGPVFRCDKVSRLLGLKEI
jgi:NAD(P)H-flavin reductase